MKCIIWTNVEYNFDIYPRINTKYNVFYREKWALKFSSYQRWIFLSSYPISSCFLLRSVFGDSLPFEKMLQSIWFYWGYIPEDFTFVRFASTTYSNHVYLLF